MIQTGTLKEKKAVGSGRFFLSHKTFLCDQSLKSFAQTDLYRPWAAGRNVSVAIRVQVIPRVEQILHVCLQPPILIERIEDRSIRSRVRGQNDRVIDRGEHVRASDHSQASAQPTQ